MITKHVWFICTLFFFFFNRLLLPLQSSFVDQDCHCFHFLVVFNLTTSLTVTCYLTDYWDYRSKQRQKILIICLFTHPV